MWIKHLRWLWLAVSLVSSVLIAYASDYVNAQLYWHEAVVDSQGKLLAWYQPGKNQGYDRVVRLAWDFMEHKVPADTKPHTGLKTYLINSTFDPRTIQGADDVHNPASVYGQFVDSLVTWYPYSGDQEAAGVVREMLDYQLSHGTTPANWEWGNVPFATACGEDAEYGRCLGGLPREYYGGIETDKVGELGIGYALFYEFTGERKYLDAAVHCADALAKHVRPGDLTHTPWPFRIDAHTGEVVGNEQVGGMIVAPVRLFDELIRLHAGDDASFQKARDIAWNWILEYPLNNENGQAFNKWSGYFEDGGKDIENLNQASPTMTAYYILQREDPDTIDTHWRKHVGNSIDWVRQYLGRGPFLGAWGIAEQRRPDQPYGGCCGRAGQRSMPCSTKKLETHRPAKMPSAL